MYTAQHLKDASLQRKESERDMYTPQKLRVHWFSLCTTCFLFLYTVPMAQAEYRKGSRARNKRIRSAQLRGLTQIVLRLRTQLQNVQKQIKQMRKQHKRELSTLRKMLRQSQHASSPSHLQNALKNMQEQIQLLQKQVHATQRSTQLVQKHKQKMNRLRRTLPNVTGRELRKGYYLFNFTFTLPVRWIRYRLNAMTEYKSTGLTGILNPLTGQNYPKTFFITRFAHAGKNTMWYTFGDAQGKKHGPFKFVVNVKSALQYKAETFVRYQWSNPMLRQLRYRTRLSRTYIFFFWASNKNIIKVARYSIDDKSLYYKLIVNGKSVARSIPQHRLTPGTHFVYARFELVNGFISPLLKYRIHVQQHGKWQNVHPLHPKH